MLAFALILAVVTDNGIVGRAIVNEGDTTSIAGERIR
jgi:hypothetical protein